MPFLMSLIGTSSKTALQTLHLLAKRQSACATLDCQELGSFPAMIGSAGLTADKREGDLATPIGTFVLSSAFGLMPKPQTLLPYRLITGKTLCIDDPSSCHYNTIIEEDSIPSDWASCEKMADFDPQYRYGIVIDSPKGSCLFMHVWKTSTTPTAGCVALSENNLLKILAWLDPTQEPLLTVDFES